MLLEFTERPISRILREGPGEIIEGHFLELHALVFAKADLGFKQHEILVYFAAWKEHIGLYPPIHGDKALENAFARYAGPKGNPQFPLNEPMPLKLIERIVKMRVKQDGDKAAAKRNK